MKDKDGTGLKKKYAVLINAADRKNQSQGMTDRNGLSAENVGEHKGEHKCNGDSQGLQVMSTCESNTHDLTCSSYPAEITSL